MTQSALAVLSFLNDIRSQRAEEFRVDCDKRFELSTVFKSPKEQAILRTKAFATPDTQANGEANVEEEPSVVSSS